MTIAQIVVLAIAGPLGLICLMKMLCTLIYKHVNNFGLFEAVLMVACAIALLVAFFGVK